ncbi:MAG: hypothetical protein JSS75_03695 [Bacteroidetes bacterium]|nr:hypothetical protein [Bacteroidota bacterium]
MSADLQLPQVDTRVEGYQVDSVVTFINYTKNQAGSPTRMLRFVLDTVTHQLRHVFVFYTWGVDGDWMSVFFEEDSFHVDSIHYSEIWNHHLLAEAQGAGLLSTLSGLDYVSKLPHLEGGNTFYTSYMIFISPPTDTSACWVSIDLATTDLRFGVRPLGENEEQFTVYYDPLSESIHAIFPSETTQRELVFFDALGRKVSSTEIAPSMTSLTLGRGFLPRGVFICMFGRQRAKFVVE